MKNNKQMKMGMILNYVSMLVDGIIIFLLNPFIIRGLSQEVYGVYSLMTSFTGYLALFEFGLGTTIIRYISKYNALKDDKNKENFLSMIFVIYFIITILIIIASIILYLNIDNIFSISLTASQIKLAKSMFIVIASSISITTISSIFNAIILGYEKFIFSRYLVLVTTFINLILTILVLIFIPSAINLTIISLIVAIISIICNIIYVFSKLKIKIKYHKFDKQLFIEIFSFSLLVFIQTLITQIYWRLDQLIIGIQLVNAAKALAIYGVAMKINDLVLSFTTVINRYQLPKITRMVLQKDNNLVKYLGNISKVVAILYILISLGFLIFGKRFITLYAGSSYIEAYYIILIVILAASLSRIHGSATDVLKALNKQGLYTIIVFISALINIILTIILLPKYTLIGAASATAVSVILGNTICYYICLEKKANINIKLLFKYTFKGFIPVIVISLISGLFLNTIIGDSIISYFSKCFIFAFIYLVCIYIFVLDNIQKEYIKKRLRRI